MGRKEYMQGKKGSISLEELRGVPLIIYRRWEAVLNQAFKEPYPNYLCINDDARTTLLWAESGAGIGIVPYSIVKHNENRELFVSQIDSPMMDTQLVLIKKKNLTFSQLGEKFWEFYGGRKPL